ncbi:hypothetical protein C2G38_2204950 [Gigaspora rosea]|uniref:Uncharacterized protein n=1 Tax=Gigaspora rosea TaxID=44941 RepID=A0A397UL66_9GLOM|nr:hypothetical protein C2G38_2204950 [Gigaspora rosea]
MLSDTKKHEHYDKTGDVDGFEDFGSIIFNSFSKDYVKNKEHLERLENEQNTLSIVGIPILNTIFFSQIDAIIKDYLTPMILEKQRAQMNELTETENSINLEIKEQEQNTQQILFSSLARTIPHKEILEHLFSIQSNLSDSKQYIKSSRTKYAELLGISRKAIDYTFKNTEKNLVEINNLAIVKHRGQYPKRLKTSFENEDTISKENPLKKLKASFKNGEYYT